MEPSRKSKRIYCQLDSRDRTQQKENSICRKLSQGIEGDNNSNNIHAGTMSNFMAQNGGGSFGPGVPPPLMGQSQESLVANMATGDQNNYSNNSILNNSNNILIY